MNIMATVKDNGRLKAIGSHERLYGTAEKKTLKEEICNIGTRKYRSVTEEECDGIGNTNWNMIDTSLSKLQELFNHMGRDNVNEVLEIYFSGDAERRM